MKINKATEELFREAIAEAKRTLADRQQALQVRVSHTTNLRKWLISAEKNEYEAAKRAQESADKLEQLKESLSLFHKREL